MAVDLLVISSHPDDAEISVGGTLILAKDLGYRTAVVDLTRGELSSRGTPEGRAAETVKATQLLKLDHRECLDLGDGAVRDTAEARAAIVRVIRKLQPQVVLAPWKDDLHGDHAGAGRLLEGAWYFCGVGNFAPGLPPYRPALLAFYMLHTPFEPSIVVDITSTWDRKLAAVNAFESQFHKEGVAGPKTKISEPHFLKSLEGRAREYGFRAGCELGEPLRWQHPPLIADPVSMLGAWRKR